MTSTSRKGIGGEKYIVVSSESYSGPSSLSEKVNHFISIGYKPVGGIYIKRSNTWKSGDIYMQAMVKNKETV